MLSASANYYSDEMSDKDCSKLNNHFHALKIKAKERYNYLTQKLLIDAQALNWAPYDADKQNQVYKDQIELENFAKNHQFFLWAEITFIKINRVSYDRFGKLCTVYFSVTA